MIRHGDVVVEIVGALPDDAKLIKNRKELAYGEVTGHAHRIDVGDLFETKNGELYLRVEKLSRLTHEEHKTVTLNPGVYKVMIKRQYNLNGDWENVRD